ncbi:HutD family protein [Xinfangfangia sp. D13-10-4-6]|uniref:HutD/Ves family protein n=1 Tax=Pseudogemmobacter hezensis TaxID=2737662 RepID=UPI0015532D76|nr:HutD family protein [Pseudogemmobacter hezensis]
MSEGIYPARGRIFRPWKNGGGETAEIAISPVSAGTETFSWRISTAWVAQDGPFSHFPGIDRILTVIEGGPMLLEVEGKPIVMDETSPALTFAGEAAVTARLLGPPLLDFNLMLRRPRKAHTHKGQFNPDLGAQILLLTEPWAGFERLDLIDFSQRPDLRQGLRGARGIAVCFEAETTSKPR